MFVRDNNLFLRDTNSKEEIPLTTDGTAKDTYHRDASRSRGVGMQFTATDAPANVGEVYWSPDSKHVIAMRTHTVPERTVYEVDSSLRGEVQPKLTSYPYFKPGDDIPVHKPHLFDVESRKEIAVNDALLATPFDISDTPLGDRFVALHVSLQPARASGPAHHRRRRRRPARPGRSSTSRARRSSTTPASSSTNYLEDTGEIIWMSERDGWNHLYLYDAKTGAGEEPDHQGRVGRARRGPRRSREAPDLVPRRRHPPRAGPVLHPLLPRQLRRHRPDDAHRRRRHALHRVFARPALSSSTPIRASTCRRCTELRRADDGQLVCELEKADASALPGSRLAAARALRRQGPRRQDRHLRRHLPADQFRSGRRNIRSSKTSTPARTDPSFPRASAACYAQQELAELGFIVVQIDGMGTSNRSKAFHDVCWKNLGDAGFPDRILWIKAAAAKYP